MPSSFRSRPAVLLHTVSVKMGDLSAVLPTLSRAQLRNLIRLVHLIAFGLILYLVISYKLYVLTSNTHLSIFYLYTLVTSTFLLSRFLVAAFYTDNHYQFRTYPLISFVIACKNEEDSIAQTIATCLASVYPGSMECIAVNDGSTDRTLAEMKHCRRRFRSRLKIISFRKNKGKREAMAAGVLAARGKIIIFVDSDSFVDRHAVKHLVNHFLSDPEVGAVSGNTLVANDTTNALTKMQSAKYGISFDIFKASESVFGLVTCCPGCFSAYKKSAVLEVLSPWRRQSFLGVRSTYGDDRSLTNYILRTKKVIYCRRAKAKTIVPEKFRKFYYQQLRWKKSWIKEGVFNTGSFIWKKHPLASSAFYINLLIPIFGPIIVVNALAHSALTISFPTLFISGIIGMSMLFGIYCYLISPNRHWPYITLFTLVYAFILIWQMPYALLKLRDTGWGTR